GAPLGLQVSAQNARERDFIFHDQDTRHRRSLCSVSSLIALYGRSVMRQRQGDDEAAATLGHPLRGDAPTHRPHQIAGNREAEAKAAGVARPRGVAAIKTL